MNSPVRRVYCSFLSLKAQSLALKCQDEKDKKNKEKERKRQTKPTPSKPAVKWKNKAGGSCRFLVIGRYIKFIGFQQGENQTYKFTSSKNEGAFMLILVDLFVFEIVEAFELGVAFSQEVDCFNQVIAQKIITGLALICCFRAFIGEIEIAGT